MSLDVLAKCRIRIIASQPDTPTETTATTETRIA